MDFGDTLLALKSGKKVTRTGWNGKNMFLFLNPGSRVVVSEGRPLASALEIGSEVEMLPYIMMYTAQHNCVPWLASQTDILSEDWMYL